MSRGPIVEARSEGFRLISTGPAVLNRIDPNNRFTTTTNAIDGNGKRLLTVEYYHIGPGYYSAYWPSDIDAMGFLAKSAFWIEEAVEMTEKPFPVMWQQEGDKGLREETSSDFQAILDECSARPTQFVRIDTEQASFIFEGFKTSLVDSTSTVGIIARRDYSVNLNRLIDESTVPAMVGAPVGEFLAQLSAKIKRQERRNIRNLRKQERVNLTEKDSDEPFVVDPAILNPDGSLNMELFWEKRRILDEPLHDPIAS